MRVARTWVAAVLLIGIAAGGGLRVSAHPMPNTIIAVSLHDDGVTFDIAVPVPELRLALPQPLAQEADLLAEPQRSAVAAYFDQHFSARSKSGVRQPHVLQSLTTWQAAEASVGQYQELRLRLFVPASATFDPRDFTLAYDAVIHQVPNHSALVHVAQDFRNGVLAGDAAAGIGVIRFDFARNQTLPLPVTSTPGSMWRGVRSAIALGFHHVVTGFDHVLFLITLLVVAPLRVRDRRWSLFQGWGYATRRFLTISLAFTLGHSAALIIGTYNLIAVPRALIEVVIAASILVAAVHAIRPIFSGREWLVAAGFGVVHGLAFSESLVGLALTTWTRALVVFGFNAGVEAAQLVAMACAVPLLIASRWRVFHTARVAVMIAAALLASLWMVERVRVLVTAVPNLADQRCLRIAPVHDITQARRGALRRG